MHHSDTALHFLFISVIIEIIMGLGRDVKKAAWENLAGSPLYER
jgi:hypothetical protein